MEEFKQEALKKIPKILKPLLGWLAVIVITVQAVASFPSNFTTLKEYVFGKVISVSVIYQNKPFPLSSKYHLNVNNTSCTLTDNTKGIFTCNVEPASEYTSILTNNKNQIIVSSTIKEHQPLIITNMPVSFEEYGYYMDKKNNIKLNFKLINTGSNQMICTKKSLNITLCGGFSFKPMDNDGILEHTIPWKKIKNYYYDSCKEGLDIEITHDNNTYADSIEKKFFFIDNTSYFEPYQINNMILDKNEIEFNGKTRQNYLTLLKQSDQSFLLKFKAKDFTSNTALAIQLDSHTIKIEGNNINFDDNKSISILEKSIANDKELVIEVKKDNTKIQVDIFQDSLKISGKNNIFTLPISNIERLKIGSNYTGVIDKKTILSIYDVSIQKQ